MSSTDHTIDLGDERRIEPLSPLEAHQATVDALHATGTGTGETFQERRHGMVEAETHRVSEEVTAQARERMHPKAEIILPATFAPTKTPAKIGERALPPALTIRQILVPLDGTSEMECALPYAIAVAQLTGASTTLVNVAGPDLPNPAAVVDRVVSSVITPKEDAQGDMPAYLSQLRDRVAAILPRVSYQALHAASPIEALVAYEERAHADLVVLATRRHPRSGLYPVGRLAESLLRRGRAALLLVPNDANHGETPVASLTRLLVPLDGSELSESALAPLRTLFAADTSDRSVRRHVTLLTVDEHIVTHLDNEVYLGQVRTALADALAPAPVEFETLVAHGMAAEVIVGTARGSQDGASARAPYDLVLMATHGRGGIGRWLFGSVAEYALQTLTIPMLLVRAHHADETSHS